MRLLGALCVLDSRPQVFSVETGPFTSSKPFPPHGMGKPRHTLRRFPETEHVGLSPFPEVQIPQGGKRAVRLRALRCCPRNRAQMCAIRSLFFSHKTLSFLPNIPEPQEKPGAEMRRRMTLEMESSLLPPSFLPLEASSLTQHPN